MFWLSDASRDDAIKNVEPPPWLIRADKTG